MPPRVTEEADRMMRKLKVRLKSQLVAIYVILPALKDSKSYSFPEIESIIILDMDPKGRLFLGI